MIRRYQKLFAQALVVGVALFCAAGIALAYSTWSGPTAAAPGNNTDTPLNVGTSNQVKSGSITAGTLGATSICIGTDCRTAWPGSQPSVIPAGTGVANIRGYTTTVYTTDANSPTTLLYYNTGSSVLSATNSGSTTVCPSGYTLIGGESYISGQTGITGTYEYCVVSSLAP